MSAFHGVDFAFMFDRRRIRDFDWFLAILALCIAVFGSWQIFNAVPNTNLYQKQLIGIGIGLTAMLIVAFTDYRRLLPLAPLFYAFGLLLLVLVLIPGIGLKINGQRAWISLGGLGQFQPSEFAKIPTVLMLASYFGKTRRASLSWKEMAAGGVMLAVPVFLILLEGDAGQAMTYFPILAVIMFLSSIRLWVVFAALALCFIGAPLAWQVGVATGQIKPYQQERVNVILDPENADPRGYGYHTKQSIITVGKGGTTGTRERETSQSNLKFLPEPQTDFIYAVTAENTGFVGAGLLLVAYAILLSRMISGARRAPDRTGMLLIMAFVAGFTFNIFINVGMVLGVLPVIGVPLPMVSAGLSAVLTSFMAIGFTISVQLRRFVN